jgi:hypothetical protein
LGQRQKQGKRQKEKGKIPARQPEDEGRKRNHHGTKTRKIICMLLAFVSWW